MAGVVVMVDFTPRLCNWCHMRDDDVYVMECPSCGELTCRECVKLLDDGMGCVHSTPTQRSVLTQQTWD